MGMGCFWGVESVLEFGSSNGCITFGEKIPLNCTFLEVKLQAMCIISQQKYKYAINNT